MMRSGELLPYGAAFFHIYVHWLIYEHTKSIFTECPTQRISYLYLPVVTDGFNERCAFQSVLRTAGAELHDGLGSTHQAGHGAPVFNQLFFLLLLTNGINTSSNKYFASLLDFMSFIQLTTLLSNCVNVYLNRNTYFFCFL